MFGVASMGGNGLSELLNSQVEDETQPSLNVMKFKIVDFLKNNRDKGCSAKELENKIKGVKVDEELSKRYFQLKMKTCCAFCDVMIFVNIKVSKLLYVFFFFRTPSFFIVFFY